MRKLRLARPGAHQLRIAIVSALALGLLTAAGVEPGYLDAVVDITGVVPPPPEQGDPRYDADRRVFRATRKLLASARGDLAKSDVPWHVDDLMNDFSCAIGIKLSVERTPATFRLLSNADADTARANDLAKNKWKRPRPFLLDKGPICEDRQSLAKSYDYPSGHTTRGWTAGLALADLMPSRAADILTRARAYGESRIVCGAHNMSAVEAGRLGATISMQRIKLSERYIADRAAAAVELQNLAHDPSSVPSPIACAAEKSVLSRSVLEGLSDRKQQK